MLNSSPKILIVGDWCWSWYQDACACALKNLGCHTVKFGWTEDFKKWVTDKTEPVYKSFFHRLQYRFLTGPLVWKINSALISLAEREKPDIVWFYNVQLITAATVKRMKQAIPGAIFCQYTNDNPFSPNAHSILWRHFKRSIPYFDYHFTYRQSNIRQFIQAGAKQPHLLRSYFIPEEDFPIPSQKINPQYFCDVVFAGHYENDGRVEILEDICRAGFKLNLFGGGWNAALSKLSPDSPLRKKFPVYPVVGEDYRQAICGAKVALCFLSTLNQDTYTRRNFQIPAMKVPMISQYTEDLANLFMEDKEIILFHNKKELLQKLALLINNDNIRNSIAEAGFKRVFADGHDISSRMQKFLRIVYG